MSLPGAAIPRAFLPEGFRLPRGFSVRQDSSRVYLVLGERVASSWDWRDWPGDLHAEVGDVAGLHSRVFGNPDA